MMRSLVLSVLFLLTSFLSASAGTPELKFDNYRHSFGKFPITKVRKCVYPFTNTGTSDLLIQNVDPSCGCTKVTYYTKTPVKPGKRGYIVLVYDARNGYEKGKFNKSVDITTNTKYRYHRIFISGETF